MNMNLQIEKDSSMRKFNPNSKNPKEAGLSCIHKACIAPSLTILADLLKDHSSNAMVVDNHMKTAAQRAPKVYLTSFKIALRYERKHFVRNLAAHSFLRPGRAVEEHDMEDDPSVLEMDQSNRSIPHEVSMSGKLSVGARMRVAQTSTSMKSSHFTKGADSNVAHSMNEKINIGETRFSIMSKREIDPADIRLAVPIFNYKVSINRDTGPNSMTMNSKMNVVSSKQIDSSDVFSDCQKELTESPDLTRLRKRLIDELQSPVIIGDYAETPNTEQPLAQKVRSYCNYSNKFNLNKYLLDKNPFIQTTKNHNRGWPENGTRSFSNFDSKDNPSLQRIALQDKNVSLINSVVQD